VNGNHPDSRPLRIAEVAPLWTAVPPGNYGGAELVVHWLTEGLVKRGHSVTLFASGDSQTQATLRPACEQNLLDTMAGGRAYVYDPYANSNLVEALRMAASFDIIHCHLGSAYIPFAMVAQTPVLQTVHASLEFPDELWVLERYPDVPIAALSYAQIAAVPTERRSNIRVIYHGCDFESYEPSFTARDYLAFLGRMGPQKNPLGAIEVAKAAGLPIVLAGKPMTAAEEAYFAKSIEPLIDGHRVTYLGSVTHAQKVDLLKGAAALLFPIQWNEHFGVVMIEAMACGCPVVACRQGSVSEVVDPGITGFYADTVEEMARLVPQALTLDRRIVREHARLRFSVDRMVDNHVALYRELVAGRAITMTAGH